MAVDQEKLRQRVDVLTEAARAQGYNSVDEDLERLPEGDVAARLGYLAALLDLDFGIAFDPKGQITAHEEA